jgi:hypothetical protein
MYLIFFGLHVADERRLVLHGGVAVRVGQLGGEQLLERVNITFEHHRKSRVVGSEHGLVGGSADLRKANSPVSRP